MRAVAALLFAALLVVGAPTSATAADPVFPGPIYLEANTDAAKADARLRAQGDVASADAMAVIAAQPTAVWLGNWWSDELMRTIIRRHVAAAAKQGATLVFVTYAIPFRDCGGHSGGGTTYDAYLDWNRVIADELEGTRAVVLIEPDSLSSLAAPKCASEVAVRPPLIRQAVDILADAGLVTYLDGGNSNWLGPAAQAEWLKKAGIARANGFFTNVSNFHPVQQESDYAGKLSARVNWKHYVIDVSRNGAGANGEWCNPLGAALGVNPRATPGTTKLDALLWVKHPGVSDGPCNGGPAAGVWWDRYAVSLVTNR
ncbi:glycoside hydrolase family 6 protein [Conyzicola nivalis]|uniref:Glucanase n=1 Tax=Conyzicola nivalis TaxID=1477021 RepID=A0A916SC09_9MICO|nr:glycoside hydrolase family 6 protein [Conyzicola nivalis]GGA93094.1 glucanase [Conyzicola nivalis]